MFRPAKKPRRKATRLALAMGGAAVLILVLWGARTTRVGRHLTGDAPEGSGGVRGFAVGQPGFGPATRVAATSPRPPPTPEEVAKEVAAVLSSWRNAILEKDADTVVRLDLTFLEEPEHYAAALVDSARTDSNERVRAFSTRELGKFARADLADLFGQLLADPSPYVRQNAAWALGELARAPEGRVAAESALAVLRRVNKRDPAGD